MTGKNERAYIDPARLRGLIDRSGVTLQSLADGTGLSLSAIESYLRGKCQPGAKALFSFADFFAVPLDFLAGRLDAVAAEEILTDYPRHFMELRTAAYEEYLTARKPTPLPGKGTYEAPWPYNLVDEVTGEVSQAPLTEDQLAGLDYALDTLSPRERATVEHCYRDGLAFREIAKKYGITQERVRQVVAKGVARLRYPARKNLIIYGRKGLDGMNVARVREEELRKKSAALEAEEQELEARRDVLLMRGVMLDEAEKRELMSKNVPTPWKPAPMSYPTQEMDLSNRAYNVLMRAGLDTLGKIILAEKEGRLTGLRNMGRKSYTEVLEKISALLCLKSADEIGGAYERLKNAE